MIHFSFTHCSPGGIADDVGGWTFWVNMGNNSPSLRLCVCVCVCVWPTRRKRHLLLRGCVRYYLMEKLLCLWSLRVWPVSRCMQMYRKWVNMRLLTVSAEKLWSTHERLCVIKLILAFPLRQHWALSLALLKSLVKSHPCWSLKICTWKWRSADVWMAFSVNLAHNLPVCCVTKCIMQTSVNLSVSASETWTLRTVISL